MPRLFDGSRFSITLLGGAVTVLMLMIIGSLVLSGQLPPRGLVTGSARAGLAPGPGLSVTFERIDGPDVVTVRADASGHFSATLPPGQYYIDREIPNCPHIGACDRTFFPIGIKSFSIAAGQHVQLVIGTCGDLWQCPR
jgi:hypothetical protein